MNMLQHGFEASMRDAVRRPRIAVLLPCYNEALAIRAVIERFRRALPDAEIYVFDNNSNDGSGAIAREAGAIVRRETRQGKGFVVRRMFADIDADIYVMCDADETYEAEAAPLMVKKLVDEGLDMVVGSRSDAAAGAYRPAHKFGNWMLTSLVRSTFGRGFNDMLSGYRVFSRRFVKSFPVMAQGFEIETELTIHALQLEMPTAEVPTRFSERLEGSQSKLSTISDGLRILTTISVLLRMERPFQFFGLIAIALAATSLGFGVPVIADFIATGLVPRLPSAVLAAGTMILASLSLCCALILDTVTRGRKEAKRLRYLALPSPIERRSSLRPAEFRHMLSPGER
jgi:hypothetical protein